VDGVQVNRNSRIVKFGRLGKRGSEQLVEARDMGRDCGLAGMPRYDWVKRFRSSGHTVDGNGEEKTKSHFRWVLESQFPVADFGIFFLRAYSGKRLRHFEQ
jgi:hypothetical protein